MNRRGLIALAVAALVALGGCGSNDRFGDPAVLDQIRSSKDCNKLQQWADGVINGDHSNQAVGYANAATDRMKTLGC